MIDIITQLFGVSQHTVIGAGTGGGVSMLLPRERLVARVLNGVGGAMIAVTSAPLASYALEYPAKLDLPIAFLLGMFGFPAAQAVFKAFRAADLWEFISTRFGGKKQ